MMKCPCKDCPDRWVDPVAKTRCHAVCERHKEWQEQNEKKKAAYKSDGEAIGAMIDHYRALKRHIRRNNIQK